MNLIINLDHDEWILDDDQATLASLGFGKPPLPLLMRPFFPPRSEFLGWHFG